MDYKVSVIIPVYKVERFIGRCARSLMEQTLDEVEFLFVDDATPDGSMQVLAETLAGYPARQSAVRVLHHERNLGLPAARNTGLAAARGEYVFHCDSDDYVSPEALAGMYEAAVAHGADMVWCDWYLTFAQNERRMKQPALDTAWEALKAMLCGTMRYNVWNKLVRRELYVRHGIAFPAGYGMGEDMTMIRLAAFARKVAYVPHAYYHYVKLNAGAFSQTYSEAHLQELRHNVDDTVRFITARYGHALDAELAFFKLEVKMPFLITARSDKFRLWQSWYPEANAYITRNIHVSWRRRMVQWCAAHGWWWPVRLHYWVVVKAMYGMIYR